MYSLQISILFETADFSGTLECAIAHARRTGVILIALAVRQTSEGGKGVMVAASDTRDALNLLMARLGNTIGLCVQSFLVTKGSVPSFDLCSTLAG
ncbi:hypothetical protein [Paraburkholderia sp.]|uniref:hypothetical protein n=1 Tax=Paraburkholderia sp. TaxID=1926495 RepID=UPI0039E33D55